MAPQFSFYLKSTLILNKGSKKTFSQPSNYIVLFLLHNNIWIQYWVLLYIPFPIQNSILMELPSCNLADEIPMFTSLIQQAIWGTTQNRQRVPIVMRNQCYRNKPTSFQSSKLGVSLKLTPSFELKTWVIIYNFLTKIFTMRFIFILLSFVLVSLPALAQKQKIISKYLSTI